MTNYICLVFTVIYMINGDDFLPKLVVTTPSLGRIQGEINPVVNNVRQFIGVPFAQPPIGALRFKPPMPLSPVVSDSSSPIYNATAAAHQGGFPVLDCLQMPAINSNMIRGKEDCLYVDIYLPLNVSNDILLPVVIYIYGGGFQTSDPRNPVELVSRYQNVIYVVIRYRVNVFGFLASTALSASRSGPVQSSGLQGFEDQQMAMQWTRDNIQSFNGDPNSITLQGHSAGAISICLHLIAPKSENLFQRAIIESGGCDILQTTLAEMEMIGDKISSHFCNSSSDPIVCLQSINGSTLLQYVQSKDYLNYFTADRFQLSIDGLIIPDSINTLFRNGKFATNVSILTGSTTAEFALFIAGGFEPGWQVQNLNESVLSQWVQFFSNGQSEYLNKSYNPYTNPNVPPTLVNYYALTDALSTGIFQCPVRRTAAYLADSKSRSVYLYSFDYVPLSSQFPFSSQSIHGEELQFVFNSPQRLFSANNSFNSDEQSLAWAMGLLWIRFVVNGNPNIPLNNEITNPLIKQLTELGGWPMYSTTNLSTYLIFSNTVRGNSSAATIKLATSDYHSPTCAAWDKIVPNPNITKRCNTGYIGSDCTKTNDGISNTVSLILFNLLFILMPIFNLNYF